MPASLFTEMELSDGSGSSGSPGGGIEEQRALQLALELSMIGFNDGTGGSDSDQMALYEENRVKKSQNMTECVPVPSSEHVAEIVGRQGCKIKALRAKTNTYIKTPVRGEEPVFVVTGRREDVAMAKREILSAAEHFSQIRASRKNNLNGSMAPGPPAGVPGQVTLQVRVPYRVVGLVVGPKGATIKRIQQQTHTYIVTPSRDKEPVFEVTGLPESVEAAKKEIEAHIALRTGGLALDSMADMEALDAALALQGSSGESFLSSLYKAGICSSSPPPSSSLASSLSSITNGFGSGYSNGNHMGSLDLGLSSYLDGPPTSSLMVGMGTSPPTKLGDLINFSPSFWGSLESRDEGLGDSPSFDSNAALSLWGTDLGSSSKLNSIRRSSSGSGGLGSLDMHPPARRISSDPNPLSGLISSSSCFPPSMSSSPTDSLGSLTSTSSRSSNKRDCLLCNEQEVTAALVPCGHNHFCMDCAIRLQESCDAHCPVCQQGVTQAIHIRC